MRRLRTSPVPVRGRAAPAETTLELVRLLMRLIRGLRRGHPGGDVQLAPRHVAAVVVLMAMPAPVAVSVLAEALQVNLATASLLVAELAAAGLATRAEDPGDHRRTLVRLDELRAGELVARWLSPLDRALAELSPERLQGALAVLRAIADRLEQGS